MSHRRSKGVSFRQRPQTRTPVGLQLLLLSLPQFSGRHLHLSFPHYPSDIFACMFNIASWKKSLIEATFSFFPFFYFPSPWQSQSSSWKTPVKFVPYSTDKLLTDFPLWLHKPINKPQTYIVTKIHLKGQWWKCCAVLCLHTSRERERDSGPSVLFAQLVVHWVWVCREADRLVLRHRWFLSETAASFF